jgi:hypothetical protein
MDDPGNGLKINETKIDAYQGSDNMEWMQKWLDRRRVKALKKKVERMKREAEEAEVVPLMPMVETISARIRRERLVVLEKAVEKIEMQQDPGTSAQA